MHARRKVIRLGEVDSTNRYLHDYKGEDSDTMVVAVADYQSAGRGQGANHWESERGKNLTMSVRICPQELPATKQYVLQEAMALAIRDTLAEYADEVTVKWPNDIYCGDRKICGTLSECSLAGAYVADCILGSGINVNQRLFTSDAPNPVSLWQLTNKEHDLRQIEGGILDRFDEYLCRINAKDYEYIYGLYDKALYRRHGYHEYRDEGGRFEAAIVGVAPTGHITLQRRDGTTKAYAFKEMEFII